jgi:hypothetical protein
MPHDLSRRVIWVAVLAALWGMHGTVAVGTTYFEKTWTGASLFSDPLVTFPTQSVSVVGTSLEWGPSMTGGLQLFRIPLVPANTLPLTEPTVVTIGFEVERITDNSNYALMLFNSLRSSHAGFIIPGGVGQRNALQTRWLDAEGDGKADFSDSDHLFLAPNMTPVVTGSADWSHTGSDFTISAAFGGGSGSAPLNPGWVERENAIGFSFWLGLPNQSGRLRSLSIKVGAIPEPSTCGLASIATAVLGAITRRLARRATMDRGTSMAKWSTRPT